MRQWTVDAFAAQPFRGNPACVVEPFEAWPDDTWMQALAAENNQAETAFLVRTADPDRFGLRWFTPLLEVPLCGHATLAAAHVLFAELGAPATRLTFETKSGPLSVARRGQGYEMDFPSQPPRRIEPPAALAKALGVQPREVWASTYLVAVVDDEATVRALRPDVPALADLGVEASGGPGNIGVAALAAPSKPYQVVSRFFAPGSGIPEDPTTGSLHCILAPLFSDKLERATLAYHQAYPGRGGDLECEVTGDRVLIRGGAVTVLSSVLHA
ncbi:PhzF family phenazine biosynthesis protein [Phenylobacterium sp.]|uniref:PhzF family phenazine biosynthesis protein n=1 Tax=Phenylobacterium sp. TaxID=1871053 RepID=UPI002811883A|nr:PhzF family phenazine biosynthesis protein [Phenylobacterium sp.]